MTGMRRAHMPGHKGKALAGLRDTGTSPRSTARTALYEADGHHPPAASRNAGELFGTRPDRAIPPEGSSQCIRAMLYLALDNRPKRAIPDVMVAARNVHRAFVYAAALLDIETGLAVAGAQQHLSAAAR